MTGSARGGDDRITGGIGNCSITAEELHGDAHSMADHARGGNDVLDRRHPHGVQP